MVWPGVRLEQGSGGGLVQWRFWGGLVTARCKVQGRFRRFWGGAGQVYGSRKVPKVWGGVVTGSQPRSRASLR